MSTPVRVRFAPSPTGYLHVGSIRSGLFNWLWARHNDGVFVLRIEDTDRDRLVEGALEQIIAAHDTLGITPDEGPVQGGNFGPYLQSKRLDIYREHAAKLTATGALYPCWCSPERLTSLREAAQAAGTAFKYDRHCLTNPQSLDLPHVLRFKVPTEPLIVGWDDDVRGHLEFKSSELDDFVAMKSDGYPTYHFANVVDDHLMEISHVLRADEWIPSTPKHLLLFAAFDWKPPIYAHLPPVQGPDGKKKLSKRDGAQSVQEYIDEGYLPEALMSFLASLGWNDGTTQEVFTPQELIVKFTLERVQKSPAQFDRERLTWINGKFLRNMSLDHLLELSRAFIGNLTGDTTDDYQKSVLALVQERVKFLAELPELVDFFYIDPKSISQTELTKHFDAPTAKAHLEAVRDLLSMVSNEAWNEAAIEAPIRIFVAENELKTGQLFTIIRVAVTGRTAAPGLFETLAVLGRERSLSRLDKAVKTL